MKKTFSLLMLVTGITLNTIAQDEAPISKSDKTFELKGVNIRRRFTIELGKGNLMQVELGDFDDLSKVKNIDSLLTDFLKDIAVFKDSLVDDLSAKRIDYFIDTDGKKRIRIQIFKPKGTSFLLNQGDLAALKLEQDTVNIICAVPYPNKYVIGKLRSEMSYYQVRFFVNQLSNLNNYTDSRLNEKITNFPYKNSQWHRETDNNWYPVNGDHTMHAKHPGGFIGSAGDQLEINAGVNLQNYKNYFVPSFNITAKAVVSSYHYKYEFGLAWEPQFLFAKDNQGSLVTYRNDFLSLILGREPITEKGKTDGLQYNFFQHLSIGYLIRNKGDFYDPHTFRIGTGGINWADGRIKLEPIFYFHDFFKGVTPGIKLSLNF